MMKINLSTMFYAYNLAAAIPLRLVIPSPLLTSSSRSAPAGIAARAMIGPFSVACCCCCKARESTRETGKPYVECKSTR